MTTERVAPWPDHPAQVAIFGRKGSGKSENAYFMWRDWPGDRVVIDPTGDFYDRHAGEEEAAGTVRVGPPTLAWPGELGKRGERLSLRYLPDHTAADVDDDIDAVVGMTYARGDCLLVVEEIGDIAPSNRVRPQMRRMLHMGRHSPTSMITTGPRPITVDPLVLAQADAVVIYDLPNPADRRRVADCIGWDPKEFDAAVARLPQHGYLRYLAKERELVEFPPLPLKRETVADREFSGPT